MGNQITFQSTIGLDSESMIVNTFQDSDPSFSYYPYSSWSANPSNLGTFSGSNGQYVYRSTTLCLFLTLCSRSVSSSAGSYVTYTFQVSYLLSYANIPLSYLSRVRVMCIYPRKKILHGFVGDTVLLYGPVGPNGAPYSAQVDDGVPANYSTNSLTYRPQTLLYYGSHLGAGTHTLKITVQPSNSSYPLTLAVDYAEVFTTASIQRCVF